MPPGKNRDFAAAVLTISASGPRTVLSAGLQARLYGRQNARRYNIWLERGEGGFNTSYPNDGDIYVSAVYEIDEKGHFKGPVPDTRGLLIRKKEYSYIELFDIPKPKPKTKGP
jgi:hypothetical protein